MGYDYYLHTDLHVTYTFKGVQDEVCVRLRSVGGYWFGGGSTRAFDAEIESYHHTRQVAVEDNELNDVDGDECSEELTRATQSHLEKNLDLHYPNPQVPRPKVDITDKDIETFIHIYSMIRTQPCGYHVSADLPTDKYLVQKQLHFTLRKDYVEKLAGQNYNDDVRIVSAYISEYKTSAW